MNDSPDLSKLSMSPLSAPLERANLESVNLKHGKAALESAEFPPDWSYETTVAEIETIINRIELGELELADVFEQFSAAMEQLRQCEAFLTQQQQQVDLLIETLVDQPEGV
jgi:exodeoxyribonuclease VII small subunit